ncbi:hypothetical protein NQT62_06615 [Limnobacter humi]|uniref:Retention module-containing protein n=1 Tax=Limnobacter humi TaxID=1778671 RepID=A0ABT1WGW7_9BURK|nr:hypothetical protein [Limnobacter humi]MCQ8896108.1 hypothetical protein [Limnobacter humi]
MAAQIIGTVGEVEGTVTVMRNGETVALKSGESISAGDLITAGQDGRTAITLADQYGQPMGKLMVAPSGSVIVDTTMKGDKVAYVFEALSQDGVTIANLDPEFADQVVMQGVEATGEGSGGGLLGLFDGGLLAGMSLDGTAAAVGAGAVGIGLLSSGSDEGTGPTSASSGGTGNPSENGGDPPAGTTGTPLDAALDPIFGAAEGTPLAAVTGPLSDAISAGASGGGGGGGTTDGPTGTPLDMVLGPLADAAGGGAGGGGTTDGPTGTPLDMVLGPLADAAGGGAGGDAGGSAGGTTGTPLDMVLDPLMGAAAGTPLSSVASMLDPSALDPVTSSLPV